MAVDYDLVILGGSSAGRAAAQRAAELRARVALVEPQRPHSPDFLALFHHHLRQGAGVAVARQRAMMLATPRSLAVLAAQGVDVRMGQGEFQRPLAVRVNSQILRSRRYLLAPAAAAQPFDRGFSLDAIAQSDALPTGSVWVMGGDPIGLELSQILARSGAEVTLQLPRPLPGTDAETALLLRSCLEADGVQIETAADPPSEAAIVWALGRQPQLAGLNLDAVGVECRAGIVTTNSRLQTTNPRIYACGEALGGYWLPHLAETEAAIAVENALFWPRRRIDYAKIPWAIHTVPELAQVGLTERQARSHYGAEVQVVRQHYQTLDAASVAGEPIGLCKLILRRGEIIGAHLVGINASETIAPIALALQQKLLLKTLATIAPSATWGEILTQVQQHDRLPHWQLELLERWFDWRR